MSGRLTLQTQCPGSHGPPHCPHFWARWPRGGTGRRWEGRGGGGGDVSTLLHASCSGPTSLWFSKWPGLRGHRPCWALFPVQLSLIPRPRWGTVFCFTAPTGSLTLAPARPSLIPFTHPGTLLGVPSACCWSPVTHTVRGFSAPRPSIPSIFRCRYLGIHPRSRDGTSFWEHRDLEFETKNKQWPVKSRRRRRLQGAWGGCHGRDERGDLRAGPPPCGWTDSQFHLCPIDGHLDLVHKPAPSNHAAANALVCASRCLCPDVCGKEFPRCGTVGARCGWI